MRGALRFPAVYDKQTGSIPIGRTAFHEKIIQAKRARPIILGPQSPALLADDVPKILAQFQAEQIAAELLIASGIDLADHAAVVAALAGQGYVDQPEQDEYFVPRVLETSRHLLNRTAKVNALVEGAAAKRYAKRKPKRAAHAR